MLHLVDVNKKGCSQKLFMPFSINIGDKKTLPLALLYMIDVEIENTQFNGIFFIAPGYFKMFVDIF